jgi:hypothetical protein
MGLHGLLRGQLYFLYVNDVHTSQEASLWTSTPCCGDSFTFLYVDDVRTSQEAWTFTDRYGDSFTFSTFYICGPTGRGLYFRSIQKGLCLRRKRGQVGTVSIPRELVSKQPVAGSPGYILDSYPAVQQICVRSPFSSKTRFGILLLTSLFHYNDRSLYDKENPVRLQSNWTYIWNCLRDMPSLIYGVINYHFFVKELSARKFVYHNPIVFAVSTSTFSKLCEIHTPA